MKKILIVDDHPLVREGMQKMLVSAHFAVDVAASGEEALSICERAGFPDLVISDIRMPKMDGFELAEKLMKINNSAKILLLAGMPLSHELERAREIGVKGYLPKASPWRDLVAAIRDIIEGGSFKEEMLKEDSDEMLTPREHEILKWLSEGKTREEMAIICGIGIETIKTHMKNIRTKLDAPNIPSAVRRAYELGVLRL